MRLSSSAPVRGCQIYEHTRRKPEGVYSANEFLTRVNLMQAYQPDSSTPVYVGRKAAVVGGGNVAMDAARCAKRLGADVTIVYRRTEKELPARQEEVEHAMEEGIEFRFLTNPVSIQGDQDGWTRKIVCQRMQLSEPDESGRARPVPIPGSEFELDVDCVIMAIGTSPNPLIKSTTEGLETHKWGGIIVDEETGLTSREGVYAGGMPLPVQPPSYLQWEQAGKRHPLLTIILLPVISLAINLFKLANQGIARVCGSALILKGSLSQTGYGCHKFGFVHSAVFDSQGQIQALHQVSYCLYQAGHLFLLGIAAQTQLTGYLCVAIICHELSVFGEYGKLGGLLCIICNHMGQQNSISPPVRDMEFSA